MTISKLQFLHKLMVILSVAPLTSCVAHGGWFNPQSSIQAVELAEVTTQAVANDMTENLTNEIGPGTGTIWLKGGASAFGAALASAMQEQGYAVATEIQAPAGEAMIPLSYTVDQAGSLIVVRMTTPTVELSRSYAATSTGASPASAVSILTRAG